MRYNLQKDHVYYSGNIPVTNKYDVIIAGAGMAGVAAAIAAARCGVKVCLIERTQTVGGTATAGLMNLFYAPFASLTGIGKELFERLRLKGFAVPGQTVPFDVEQCTIEMMNMLEEAGAELLLDTWITDIVYDDVDACGLIIVNKSGVQALLCDRIVDASGDGDVCVKAGYSYIMGRDTDHMTRPMTLIFTVGGIDVDRMVKYVRENPKEFAPDPNECIVNMDIGEIRIFGFFGLVRKAQQEGNLSKKYNYFRIESVFPDRGTGTVNAIRVYNSDGTNAQDITAAICESRRQQQELLSFMKNYVPGFENCYLLSTAQSIGVRDSRRILGEYCLTETDIANHKEFADCIGIGKGKQVLGPSGEGHSPDGNEGDENDKTIREAIAEYIEYQIPYRILIPRGSRRILVAGKIVSCDIMANKHLRNQPACMTTGEAAGTAAAVSAKTGVDVSDIDISKVQALLDLPVEVIGSIA